MCPVVFPLPRRRLPGVQPHQHTGAQLRPLRSAAQVPNTRPSGDSCRSTPNINMLTLSRSLWKDDAHTSDSEDEDLPPQRRPRRKSRRRRSEGEGEEPPIIRGLWVQEIDWLKSAQRETLVEPDQRRSAQTDTSGASDSDCGVDQDSESMCTHESDSDSSCCAEDEADVSNSTFDLVSSSRCSDWDSTGRERGLLEPSGCFDDAADVLDELRGRVVHVPKQVVSSVFSDTLNKWKSTKHVNEGLLFHPVRLKESVLRTQHGSTTNTLLHVIEGPVCAE